VHGGWFVSETATAYRHLSNRREGGHEALCRTIALLPSIRFLQPLTMCWRRTAGWTTWDTADCRHRGLLPGELALVLASCVAAKAVPAKAVLLERRLLAVTDLRSRARRTRHARTPILYLTKQQVAELVQSYLGNADANIHSRRRSMDVFQGCLPSHSRRRRRSAARPTRDDTSSAIAAGVDAGLTCGRACHMDRAIIGPIKASTQALDAIGLFLTDSFKGENR